MKSTDPVAGRVDPDLKRVIEETADEMDVTVSEVTRRALEYYVQENPDRIDSIFESERSKTFNTHEQLIDSLLK